MSYPDYAALFYIHKPDSSAITFVWGKSAWNLSDFIVLANSIDDTDEEDDDVSKAVERIFGFLLYRILLIILPTTGSLFTWVDVKSGEINAWMQLNDLVKKSEKLIQPVVWERLDTLAVVDCFDIEFSLLSDVELKSFDSELVKLELHSDKLCIPSEYLRSLSAKPSRINNVGRAFFTSSW